MDKTEKVKRWLWHAFHGIDRNTGAIDPTELKVLTAHVGASLGAHNTGSIAGKVSEKFKCNSTGSICFQSYLDFLKEQNFLQNENIDNKKLEDTCWMLSFKKYETRDNKIVANPELKKLWQIFNFLAEPETYPVTIDREEMALLMEKLVLALGMKWDMTHFEYVTKDLKTFTFNKMLCCYESTFAKGMDKVSIAEAVLEVYDEIIEEVEKKGLLFKRGHKIKSWKERWFVLKPGCLSYYTNRNEKEKKGDVFITSCWEAENIPDQKSYKNVFAIWTKECKQQEKTRYELSAPDPRTRQAWLIAVRAIVQREQTKGKGQYGELLKRREKRRLQNIKLEEERKWREAEFLEKKSKEREIEDLQKAQEAAQKKAAEELALRLLNEEGERRQRQLEKEEREQAERKMKSINAAKLEAERRAEEEAARRIAKEEEEEKRRWLELQERERQTKELEAVNAARLEAVHRANEEARLRKLKEKEEKERRRLDYQERAQQAKELEEVKAARLAAEKKAEEEAKLRKAKEEEEEKRRLLEEEERARQAQQLEELRMACADASKQAKLEEALKEAEKKRKAELEALMEHMRIALEEERKARTDAEEARALHQRLLEQEALERERFKEKQDRIFREEQQRREDLELKSEVLSKQREEKEALLEIERARFKELENERMAADQQLKVALEKIDKAEKLKERKEMLRRELLKPVGLARPIQPSAKPLFTHRGLPQFLDNKLYKEQQELIHEIEAGDKTAANGHSDGCNGQQTNQEGTENLNR
ncbi:uncharacterized protein [Asterias amurensis]|uniref:uncharacterized protein n=1 Tax=Asterias amurensis TaxID=7602 RepID=UPI003AB769EA